MWAKLKTAFHGSLYMGTALAGGAGFGLLALAVLSAPLSLAGYQVDFDSAAAYWFYALSGILFQGYVFMSGWRPKALH